jgi:hypothetical protein
MGPTAKREWSCLHVVDAEERRPVERGGVAGGLLVGRGRFDDPLQYCAAWGLWTLWAVAGSSYAKYYDQARLIASRVTSRYPTTPTTSTVRSPDAGRGGGDAVGSGRLQWACRSPIEGVAENRCFAYGARDRNRRVAYKYRGDIGKPPISP